MSSYETHLSRFCLNSSIWASVDENFAISIKWCSNSNIWYRHMIHWLTVLLEMKIYLILYNLQFSLLKQKTTK